MSHSDHCGRPVAGTKGRLPTGWVKVKVTGNGTDAGHWYCSPACAIAALAGVDQRPDVATCPVCINRHDRDHKCAACGSRPQIIATKPTPVPRRLYLQPQRDTA